MKHTAKAFTLAVTLSGLLLGVGAIGAAPEAEAQTYRRTVTRRTVVSQVPVRSTLSYGDWDRDGIRNSRDRDDDNDGIRDRQDRNRYSRGGTRYGNRPLYGNRSLYRNGTVMRDATIVPDGTMLRNDRIVHSRTAGWRSGTVMRHDWRNDLDRDGIQDHVDKDRDGDGVRNVHDRRPDNFRVR